MKAQELIFFAKAYSFINDDNEPVQGGEIHVLAKGVDESNDFGTSKGHKVAKFKVPYEVAQKILSQKVPALYDVEYDIRIDRDNRSTLFPVDFALVKEFKVI